MEDGFWNHATMSQCINLITCKSNMQLKTARGNTGVLSKGPECKGILNTEGLGKN